jgi:hypothetical protein
MLLPIRNHEANIIMDLMVGQKAPYAYSRPKKPPIINRKILVVLEEALLMCIVFSFNYLLSQKKTGS